MRNRIYRDKNGRLARVQPTATGYLIRYRGGHTTSISIRQTELMVGECRPVEVLRAQ